MIDKIYSNYKKILLTSLLILPFLDIYRLLIGNKFEIAGLSVVEILNFIFTALMLILLGIKLKKEKRKMFSRKYIIYLLIVAIYLCLHCIYIVTLSNLEYFHTGASIISELYYIIRSYILPLIILFVYMKSELDADEVISSLSIISFIFSIIIVVTNILGIAVVAYSANYEGVVPIKGNIFTWFGNMNLESVDLYTSRGLFYSTNQVSAILGSLLFISSFYTLYKDNIKYYLSFFIKIIAAIMISTKTAFFAIILSIIAIYIYNLIIYILYKRTEITKKSYLFILYLIITVIIFKFSPINYKLQGYINNVNNDELLDIEDDGEVTKGCASDETINLQETYNLSPNKIIKKKSINNIEKEYITNYLQECPYIFNVHSDYTTLYPVKENYDYWIVMIRKPVSFLTNYRNFKYSIYMDFIKRHDNVNDKMLGIGYSSNFPYLEIDFVGQYVWLGLTGATIFLIPYIIILIKNLINIVLFPKNNFNSKTISLSLASSFMFFASVFAGHVFGIFLTSTILALLLSGLNTSVNNSIKLKDNKLTFLLLHLGYGGIETSTINTANALCSKYDIEIISFYKLSNNQSNKINKNINIKYLYDGGPNREEFKKYLKEHKYIKTFREGIKAINILIRKKLLVIRAIIDSDSKYIVSTRWEFSILLSRYGNKNSIKIAQEHHYHNNNQKYIKVISNKYNNIDYLCALTKTLEEDYKKFLINNKHTKVILLPNMITEIPKVNSSLKEKNIITVSRLDYGKRNDEIIKAFSKIEENDWKLYIIGDGNEYNNLSNLVKELELEDRVILTGYKDKKEIEKYMLKSSIFLMASVSEGLPMVLLEAMSYGIPCIAYETDSGTSDIIEDCKNGYIIKNRNEEEYIERIETLIQNEDTRKEFGKYAKQSVNSFSKEEITKIWEKILNSGE